MKMGFDIDMSNVTRKMLAGIKYTASCGIKPEVEDE